MTGDQPGSPKPAQTSAPGAGGRPPDPVPVRFAQLANGEWVQWMVVEVDAAGVPGARGPRCLVFTRADCIRRVWDYPTDWRTLDAAGLTALSWRR